MFFKPKAPATEQIQQLMQLFAEGRIDDLIDEASALARKFPKAAQLHNILSVAYNAAGDFDAAADSAETAIRLQPDYPKALLNLGNALANLDDAEGALKSYRQAVLLSPDFAEGHNNLGTFLFSQKRYEEAVVCFNTALEIRPDYIKAHNNLGCALIELGRNKEAIASLQTAIGLHPDYAEAHNNIGGALLDAGRKNEAIVSFRQAIKLNPLYTEAYRQLADLVRMEADDPLYIEMRRLYASGELTHSQRMHLCFGLSRAEENMGNIDTAFSCLKEGNDLRKDETGYNIEDDRELFGQIKAAFSCVLPESSGSDAHRNSANKGITPVFIVGMPRSGTSLVEQILSTHSDVYGAGEVLTLDHGIHAIAWSGRAINPAEMQRLRSHYLSWLEDLHVDASHITDKMTTNFRWIGFILQAMPEARIVHIRRDAMATCWSNYKLYFETDGHGFGNDLADIAAYYKLYADLMDFWEKRFPGRIHHIDYEALTENQEAETRRLLQYCNLPWEAACLDFHLSERAVSTASNQQVRKKMYQGSSDAWRKYEAQLQPMIRLLEGY